MTTNQNIPWIEKYRPTHFDNIVLDPMNRTLFQNILSTRYFPHLLFYGPPGTGKTTTVINLINEYQTVAETTGNNKHRENVIHLNASDERGIDIIRIQINQFVRTKNMFETGYKFVILDEVDYMTKNAQQALKSLLQTCRNNVRFCLICNYISKIDDSLKNEFICVRFNQLPKREIYSFIKHIASSENVPISDESIDTIQEIYKSDIRSIINFIQLHHHLGSDAIASGKNIITNQTWMQLHSLFLSGEYDDNDGAVNDSHDAIRVHPAIKYIHEISVRYNMDKRTIVTTYFNYVVRNITEMITPEYLAMMEHVVHAVDDTPIDSILQYICHFRQ